MGDAARQHEQQRSGLSGLGAISVLLAAVVVLTSSPSLLAGRLAESSTPISRMGAQLLRIAAVVPALRNARPVRRDLHRPLLQAPRTVRGAMGVRIGVTPGASPIGMARLVRVPLGLLDLPPPSRV